MNENIKNKGYSKYFLNYLKISDLFITLKDFPDLGYAEMESGILKIPIAKYFTNNSEEIIPDKTGILGLNYNDLFLKLRSYLRRYPSEKHRLGKNLYDYINRNKDARLIIQEWENLFKFI